ncbi:MAG: signal peptide peptidase SppA [Prevotellaceae bacterium]|jgi:protease-4|nr:signal peptide peptidase SppA [Prevotellaceae bacterium]
MKFLKSVLAAAIGSFVAMGVLSLVSAVLFVGVMVSAIIGGEKMPKPLKSSSILELKLDKEIVDRSSDNLLDRFSGLSFSTDNKLGLNDILKSIEHAEADDKIAGIYIDATTVMGGLASIEEIRNALLKFKNSGKFIVAYGDVYSQKAYYLSSLADKIYVNPEGGVDFKGLAGSVMFYKGALDKLGIDAQIIRHGKFKSAVEPFMYDKMSPENREQINTYVGSIWSHMITGISQSRNISRAMLNDLASKLSITESKDAVQYNFVDATRYKDQVLTELAELSLLKATDEPRFVSLDKYRKYLTESNPKAKEKIAVVYALGEISDEGKNGIVGNTLADELRAIRKDSTVKAVVLRVNSPGGSALASEIIWREVDLINQIKPVVVSMGDVAASGGYYIAAPASAIVANPTTITGSIGVLGVVFNVQKGAKEKLGITVDVAKTNDHSDMGNMFRPLSNTERSVIQKSVENVYGTFTKHVSDGRKMSVTQVDNIGQGRVWSGVDAKNIRLIDEFGGLNEAIAKAANISGVMDYKVVEYPKKKDQFAAIFELLGETGVKVMNANKLDVWDMEPLAGLRKQHGTVQARLPFVLEVE